MLIIIGQTNPHPHVSALSPDVPGTSGHRLWQLSGLTRDAYVVIRRTNADDWASCKEFRADLSPADVVLALGDEVRRWLWLPRQLIIPVVVEGVTYRQIPHPSGRNLFYNDPLNRQLVEVLFRCLTKPDSLTSAEALMATFASGQPSLRRSRS